MKRKTMPKPIPNAPQSKSSGFQKKSSGNLPKKVKQPSKSTVKGKAWSAFSKYIRLRDALRTTGILTYVKCITCGKLLKVSFCDAGHFISRRYNATLFDERNVHTQCRYCNRFLDGNLLEYRRQIIRIYGEGIDIELEDKATEIKKYSVEDLTNIAECYNMKYKRLTDENLMQIRDSQMGKMGTASISREQNC